MNKNAIIAIFVVLVLGFGGHTVQAQNASCTGVLTATDSFAGKPVSSNDPNAPWLKHSVTLGTKNFSLGKFYVTASCGPVDIYGIALAPMAGPYYAGGLNNKNVRVPNEYAAMRLFVYDGSVQHQIGSDATNQVSDGQGYFYQDQPIHFAAGETKAFEVMADIKNDQAVVGIQVRALVPGYFIAGTDASLSANNPVSKVPYLYQGFDNYITPDIPSGIYTIVANGADSKVLDVKNSETAKKEDSTGSKIQTTTNTAVQPTTESVKNTQVTKQETGTETTPTVAVSTSVKISFWTKIKNFFQRLF